MKKKSYLAEAFIGLALTLFVLFGYLFPYSSVGSPMEGLELRSYDMRARLRESIDAGGSDLALIAIDDDSIARLGRFPWPRSRMGQMIDLLASAKAKIVGLEILLSESEQNQGLKELQALQAQYEDLLKTKKIVDRRANFSMEFSSAAVRLDTDQKLRASLASAGNVVIPMFFSGGGSVGAKAQPLPPSVSSAALTVVLRGPQVGLENAANPLEGKLPIPPLDMFAQNARGVGYDNLFPDFDGVVRGVYPALKYGDTYLPSFALEVVSRYLGYESSDIKVHPGQSIEFGNTRIPIDQNQSMLVTYSYNNASNSSSFRYYCFYDVLNGKVSMDVFKDKIVLVGASATGVASLYVTPVSHNLPGMEISANVIENILTHKFLLRPDWALNAELGAIAFIGLFIMLLLPRLRAFSGAIIALILVTALYSAGSYLFIKGQWLKVTYPAFLLGIGYVVIQTKRFIFTERGKELVEASAIETNKMLGLSFQGQGMLDLAFDKFRLCPMDDQLKDILYNLALDFERKRQYNKAVAVYEHIGAKDPKYKDIQEKMKVLKQAAAGAVFGSIGGSPKEGTVLVGAGATRPTLGRYEIEKEIGRGAMGVVYLGKDPKINRKVAIKTMMLEEGTAAAAAKETKERFFREAESAGTLNHPNIIRIFDAGEEHDVCYIAMELLEGHDFTKYTSKESLLPVERVLEAVAQVADALDYAHAQGIIHRDVKPANIMHLSDGTIRVADFGIARIAASSKTATGTVMGTPSYMSPEQVAGKKVDGRSDLFSLGTALFELLTGEKPFKGGEGIGTLLFQIASEAEPDPAQLNPNVPVCACAIVHKALRKNPEDRYQRGADMAAALRDCLAAVRGAPAAEAAAAPASEPKAPPPLAAASNPAPIVSVPTAPSPETAQAVVASATPPHDNAPIPVIPVESASVLPEAFTPAPTPETAAGSGTHAPGEDTQPTQPVPVSEQDKTEMVTPLQSFEDPAAAPPTAPESADATIRLTVPKKPT